MISWINVALTCSCCGSSVYMSSHRGPESRNKKMNEVLEEDKQEARHGSWAALNSTVQVKNPPTVILHRALPNKGRLISPSQMELWCAWSDYSISGAQAPANRYLYWWAPLPGATGVPAWIPCPLFSSPLTVFCHCVISNHCQVADCTLPSTKVSGFSTQTEMNIIMGARMKQTTYQARKQLISVVSGFHGWGRGVHFLDRQV